MTGSSEGQVAGSGGAGSAGANDKRMMLFCGRAYPEIGAEIGEVEGMRIGEN